MDTAVRGNVENYACAGFTSPLRPDLSLLWQGRFVLKGVLHPLDALRARDHGLDGVILSNHGGRQLDGAVSPLRVLPAARAAVGSMPIMVDSGFRRGSDVLKALALGADFVFIGRPFNYAATIAGAEGVAHAVNVLLREIDCDLGLLGVNRIDDLGPQHLLRRGEVADFGLPALPQRRAD